MGVFTVILGDIEGAGITLWPRKVKRKVTLKTVNSLKHRIPKIVAFLWTVLYWPIKGCKTDTRAFAIKVQCEGGDILTMNLNTSKFCSPRKRWTRWPLIRMQTTPQKFWLGPATFNRLDLVRFRGPGPSKIFFFLFLSVYWLIHLVYPYFVLGYFHCLMTQTLWKWDTTFLGPAGSPYVIVRIDVMFYF